MLCNNFQTRFVITVTLCNNFLLLFGIITGWVGTKDLWRINQDPEARTKDLGLETEYLRPRTEDQKSTIKNPVPSPHLQDLRSMMEV